jgi:dihydrofolate reductase
MIGLIWAQSRNGIIGADGKLPWHLPEDLAHFRNATLFHTVVMGRRTFESLPDQVRPLPKRNNVVLTRDPDWSADGVEVVHSIEEALTGRTGIVWVAGGASVYQDALPYADLVVITEIDLDYGGDVKAPELSGEWVQTAVREWATSKSGLRFRTVWRMPARNVDPVPQH